MRKKCGKYPVLPIKNCAVTRAKTRKNQND